MRVAGSMLSILPFGARCAGGRLCLGNVAIAAAMALVACTSSDAQRDEPVSFAAVVDSIATEYQRTVGASLNRPMYVHFVRGGQRLLVLDMVDPHLRLLDVQGRLLWSGLGADADLGRHLGMGVRGDTAVVAQRGRITAWVVSGDAIRAAGRWTLPETFRPLGVVPRCDHGWYLYATSDEPATPDDATTPLVGTITFIHAMDLEEGPDARLSPVWSVPTQLPLHTFHGHSGSLISGSDTLIAVLHRPHGVHAGELVELNCDGELLRSVPELKFVTGEADLSVLEPRPRALEWTAGIAALPDGFLTAQHRWFSPRVHGVDEEYTLTEVFEYRAGELRGSTLMPGIWSVVAYDTTAGAVFTSARWNDANTRLIVIPATAVHAAMRRN